MDMIRGKGISLIVLLLLWALWTPGCATTNKIKDDILRKGPVLRKKVGFLPAAANAALKAGNLQESAAVRLKDYLRRRCEGLIVAESRKVRQALASIPRLDSGRIQNTAIAGLGRDYGLSVVLDPQVADVEYVTAKRGVWGFRRITEVVRVYFLVRAYDVETTALFFDKMIQEEMELSEGGRRAKETGVDEPDWVEPVLSEIIPRAGDLVCDRLAEEPWKGYVTDSSEERVIVSAGKDVGLAPGEILEVFGKGKAMKGQDAYLFFLLGAKLGKAKVVSVKEDTAEAVRVSGILEEGWSVRLKP
jgi:hypothetical protein